MRLKPCGLKRGFIRILLAEAGVLLLFFAATLKVYYDAYAGMLHRQADEFVALYVDSVEHKLKQIENVSYNIISDVNIQAALRSMEGGGGAYREHLSVTEVRRSLQYYLFSAGGVRSITLVVDGGREISVGYRADDAQFTPAQLERAAALAAEKRGGNLWLCDLGEEGEAFALRQVLDISGYTFSPYGVLLICCDMSALMEYTAPVSRDAANETLILADGRRFASGGGPSGIEEVDTALLEDSFGEFVSLNGRRFLATGASSSYTGWRFYSLFDASALHNRINRLTGVLSLAFAAVMGAALLLAIRYASRISAPVGRLSRMMGQVEEGDYGVDLSGVEEGEMALEIGGLYRAFRLMVARIDHLINHVYRHELELQRMRYKILQDRINPHFLYNTLDTVNWKAIQGGNGEISTMVRSLGSLLRQALRGEDVIPLEEEAGLLEHYIAIQRIRFEERLVFAMRLPGTAGRYRIPKLTIQPLVENSIQHGLQARAGTCFISVGGRELEDCLEIEVRDNGGGMPGHILESLLDGEENPGKAGIGVKNVDRRLRLTFGEDWGLRIDSEAGVGTVVRIRLPREETGGSGGNGYV